MSVEDAENMLQFLQRAMAEFKSVDGIIEAIQETPKIAETFMKLAPGAKLLETFGMAAPEIAEEAGAGQAIVHAIGEAAEEGPGAAKAAAKAGAEGARRRVGSKNFKESWDVCKKNGVWMEKLCSYAFYWNYACDSSLLDWRRSLSGRCGAGMALAEVGANWGGGLSRTRNCLQNIYKVRWQEGDWD